MKTKSMLLLGLFTLSLSGCAESSEGYELCERAAVEHHCGIYAADCQEALRADERFNEDSSFYQWTFEITEDDRCEMTVT